MSFDSAISATTTTWDAAQAALDALNTVDTKDMAAFSKAMIEANLKIGIATSTEQKTGSAIDKAYQAHGQLASK